MTRWYYRQAVAAGLLIMVTPFAMSVWAFARDEEKTHIIATPREATRCVRDATWMRYEHMSYLRQLRDRVVRGGERAETRTMESCHGCHVSRAAFCDRCHARAGVTLDCFGCHEY